MRLPPKNPAFSLVEVMIAIGVVAFALLSLLALLPLGLRIEKESAEESAAVNLLAAIRADLRNSAESGPSTV
jgi:uncharacterized protein (TIGR02598 family)